MKKLFYVLTLVLLLAVVPVSTVEAKTTKPDKPTVEVKYNTKSNKWLLRFNCKTKGATVKCKDFEETKYKTVKVGKWLDASNYTYGDADDFLDCLDSNPKTSSVLHRTQIS